MTVQFLRVFSGVLGPILYAGLVVSGWLYFEASGVAWFLVHSQKANRVSGVFFGGRGLFSSGGVPDLASLIGDSLGSWDCGLHFWPPVLVLLLGWLGISPLHLPACFVVVFGVLGYRSLGSQASGFWP